jgi:xylose isomerase
VFAYAAAQIKHALEATLSLGGENYVFWGGREGYDTLLNTNMRQEADQMARLFHMAVAYAKKIGFKGQFLIEPKPKEPTKHQYDFDTATVLNFLKTYDLSDHFKLNIEANHATLAGHSFAHELTMASDAGKLGSVDINRGDPLLGWDTDQFPTDLYDTIAAMMVILNQGGIGSGGLNFDAKLKRGSTDPLDLFYAHIGGMDTFARGLIIAHNIIQDGQMQAVVTQRYHSWSQALGQKILSGRADLSEMETYILKQGEPVLTSGRQEYLENMMNQYI